MLVRRDRLGLEGDEPVDCMNLKINDPMLHDMLCHEDGIMPSYHMNKRHWITVLLDGTVADEKVFEPGCNSRRSLRNDGRMNFQGIRAKVTLLRMP